MAIKFFNDVAVDSNVLYVDTINDRVGIGQEFPSTKLEVAGRAIIGTGNTIGTVDASIIGSNNNATTDTIIDSNTSAVIGDANSGRYGNTVISDRTLRIGRADNIGATSSNTTGILNFNDFVGGNNAYVNFGGFLGYFPPPTSSNDYYFFTAHDKNVLDSVFQAGASPEAARINMSTSPRFGTNSAGNDSNSVIITADGNNSAGAGLYFTANQNHTNPSSRGIFTFDARHQNQNATVPNGHSLFEVTSGYGQTKFLIKQVSGSTNVGIGTTNPLTKLQVGDGTNDDAVRSYFNDGSYTEMRGYGLQFSRAASYIRPTADNTKTLYLGSNVAQWNTLSIDASTTTFNTNGGENMRITSSGNVGIGTTSPSDYKLDIVNTNDGTTGIGPFRVSAQANAGTVAVFENTTGLNTSLKISDTIDDMYVVSRNGIMGLGPSSGWSSSNLNIKSNGYVGIGNRNPSERLHVKNGNLRVDTGRVNFYEGSTNRGYVGPNGSILDVSSTYKIVFKTGAAQTEKMRLTDDGRLLLNAPDNASAANSRFEVIGTSSDSTTNLTFKTSGRIGLGDYNPDAKITVVGTTNNTSSNLVKIQNVSNTGSVVDFRNSGGVQAGKISMPTSTTVNYGTTSDYRLKTNITALRDGIEKVKKLKPSRFEWIDNGVEVDGFIAHEVAKVVPEAVTGEKDAVDQKNKPVYQDLDYSKVIPVLTAALQEAIQKIEQLETRIQTLENK